MGRDLNYVSAGLDPAIRSISEARAASWMPGSRPGMTTRADPIREAIRDRALASGFDAVGFAEAHLPAEAREALAEFIACGYHGDMGWLAGTAVRRGDPQALWPDARTVV